MSLLAKKSRVHQSSKPNPDVARGTLMLLFAIGFVGVSFGIWYLSTGKSATVQAFTDYFTSLSGDSLAARGWILQGNEDSAWSQRSRKPGVLTLFTLPAGDRTDATGRHGIRNLLLRATNLECFSTEIHFDNFFPGENSQQTGLVLMEEGPKKGRSLRVAIVCDRVADSSLTQPEISLQVVLVHQLQLLEQSTPDSSKPEDIVHLPLFAFSPGQEKNLNDSLRHAAIRIEKKADHYRILYSAGRNTGAAFREVMAKEISFRPRYVGLFAAMFPDTLSSFDTARQREYLPVEVTSFSLTPENCK